MRRGLAALALGSALALIGGCGSDEGTGTDRAEIRLAMSDPVPNFTRAEVEGTREVVFLSPQAALTGRDIQSAQVLESPDGPAVDVHFTKSGAEKIERFTRENKGKRMAIRVDGSVVVAPLIMMPIADGKMLISGKMTPQRAAALAAALGSPPND
jgi:preprotein translocase subunit SecD